MLHKTQLSSKLNNANYITKALDEMNMQYKVAKDGEVLKTVGRFSVHEKVDILITHVNGKSIDSAVGFQKQADGTYTAIGDFYGLPINETKLRNLTTTTAKKIEINDRLMQLGYSLTNSKTVGDELELTFTSWE